VGEPVSAPPRLLLGADSRPPQVHIL